MMHCSNFRQLAGEFLEDPTGHPELAAHASACPACSTLVEELKAISAAAASLPNIEPGENVWLALRDRAGAEGLLSLGATMDCEEFELYAGGVLEGERHPLAFDHLYSCAGCRDRLHELDAVARAAHKLPYHQPSPRLWKRIRAAARAEDLWQEDSWWESWLIPQPVLASGLSAVALAAALVMFSVDLSIPTGDIPGRSSIDVARSEMTSSDNYASRYNIHLLNVERAVLDEGADIDDHLVDLTEKPLGTVDRAIENTQRALAQNPGDLLMQDELNRLYRQKATVLTAMTDLTWQEYGE